MDLRSENPYWLLKNGLINTYPSLQKHIQSDITVIGAGITGALVAWHLHHAGFNITIVDKRHVGMASTCASTGLLQYEIDTPLYELCKKAGIRNAVRSYELCRNAIHTLEKICTGLPVDSEFKLTPSLQFASYKKHVKPLKSEFELRKKHGFEIEWLEQKDIKEMFGVIAPGGVFSRDGGEVNAYNLSHGLLQDLASKEVNIYDNTAVINIIRNKTETTLITANGYKIKTGKVVIACGYESQRYLTEKVETWHSTYAIVSEPFISSEFWHRNALIWETATPYLYFRTTKDNRILVGGLDDDFYDPLKRDKYLSDKANKLQQKFMQHFAHLEFKIDFRWAGTFASTKDGLPYIGKAPGIPNTFFALGYGGNGITFSVIAAEIIRDMLLGKNNGDADIFSFNR